MRPEPKDAFVPSKEDLDGIFGLLDDMLYYDIVNIDIDSINPAELLNK